MAITQNTATGNGSQTNYTFTFPYIEEDDVKVSLDGVDTTAYTFANATTIQFNSAPGVGVAIRIYRDTSDENLSAVFYSGSAIRSQDLNDNFTQALYVAQETKNTTIQASTGNLADGSITSNLIANGAVSVDKLGTNAVTEAKLANTAVTTAKLADSAVTTAKLADSAVTTAKLADSAVTTAKLADGAVTAAKITDSAVTTAKIADGTISASKLGSDSITTLKIADANVTEAKLAFTPVKLDTAQTFAAQQTFTTDTVFRNTSVTADPDGTKIAGLIFKGYSGSSFDPAAEIYAEVDDPNGTVSGAIYLAVTRATESIPTTRYRVDHLGTHAFVGEQSVIFSKTEQPAGTSYATFIGQHSSTGVTSGTNSVFIYSNGNIYNTNNVYSQISDISLKENIVDANSQWDDVKALRVVNYNYKEETGHPQFRQLGFIAQEVEQVSPGLVETLENGDQQIKGVKTSLISVKAFKALQEAMERIEQLEALNLQLSARLSNLETSYSNNN